MTLLLLDGCEDFSSWLITGSGQGVVAGRNGSGWQHTGSTSNWLSFPIQAAEQTDTVTVGWAWKSTGGGSSGPDVRLYSDNNVTEHIRITTLSGALEVRRGATLIFTAPVAWTDNTWFYVEVTVKLGDTLGTVSAKVNGATVGTPFTGDTKNAGTKTVFDYVRFMGTNTAACTMDDIYVTNDATPLGDIKVETLYPNGNGAASAWAGSDGNSTDNYLLVDEVGTPDVGDYVSSSTAGQQDLYTMTDLAAGLGSVRAVFVSAHSIKTDSGSRQVKLLARGGATNASPARDLSTSFVGAGYGWMVNPETGSPWTRSEVNALQTGVECV